MASPRKSERLISSRGHDYFTISPPQLRATATRFPSYGSGRPGLVLRTATKLSSVGFEPTAVLTFGLRVRCLNHSATRSNSLHIKKKHTFPFNVFQVYSLHSKLERYGISGLELDWFTSYLQKRKQFCKANSTSSNKDRFRKTIAAVAFIDT